VKPGCSARCTLQHLRTFAARVAERLQVSGAVGQSHLLEAHLPLIASIAAIGAAEVSLVDGRTPVGTGWVLCAGAAAVLCTTMLVAASLARGDGVVPLQRGDLVAREDRVDHGNHEGREVISRPVQAAERTRNRRECRNDQEANATAQKPEPSRRL